MAVEFRSGCYLGSMALEERISSADFEVLGAGFSLCVARFVVCLGPHTNLVICATGHLK